MIEPECAFADLNDNMDLAEAMLKYEIRYVLENGPEEMNFFNSFVDKGLLDLSLIHIFPADEKLRKLAAKVCKEVNPEISVFELSLIHICSG